MNANNHLFAKQHQQVKALEIRMNETSAEIGVMSLSMESPFAAPTLWGALSDLVLAVSSIDGLYVQAMSENLKLV
jgi:hypothetical protein